jgi:hypothetical protein
MLGKMLIHGAVAAALIGAAAAVYAQASDQGTPTASAQSAPAQGHVEPGKTTDGYLHPAGNDGGTGGEEHANAAPRHHHGGTHDDDDHDDSAGN